MSGTTALTTRRNVPQGLNFQQAAVRASDLTRGFRHLKQAVYLVRVFHHCQMARGSI